MWTRALTPKVAREMEAPAPREGDGPASDAWFGMIASVVTGVLTVVTFALALTALPNDVRYPFTEEVIAAQWPGDYLWMYAAMLLMISFVALAASIHQYAHSDRKIYGVLGSRSWASLGSCSQG
jgi:hypothetical protein